MSALPAKPSRGCLARVDQILDSLLRGLCILTMLGLVVLVSLLVLVRFVPFMSLGWSDEIVELAFAWTVFMGTAAVWRSHEHITIDMLPQALAGTRAGQVLDVIVNVLTLAFLAAFTWQGWLLMLQARGNTSPMLILPRVLWYAPLPICGLIMIGYTVSRIVKDIRAQPASPESAEAH